MSQRGEERVREVYEAALTRPPGERASYVAKVAGPDTELRERVEALLSGQADTVLPGYEPGGAASEPLLGTGTQIGSYQIASPVWMAALCPRAATAQVARKNVTR